MKPNPSTGYRSARGARSAVAACAAACLAAGGASAATLSATPATLNQALARAGPGDTVELAPGAYGRLVVKGRSWTTPVTLKARGAHFGDVLLVNVDGMNVVGGFATSDDAVNGHAVLVRFSHHVSISDMQVSQAKAAITIDRSEDIVLRRLTVFGVQSDGVDIAMSHKVLVDHLTCRDFHPTLATFDAAGDMLKDGNHPDCVQTWSRSNLPPASDITITNSSATGMMQGFSFFNHAHDGVDDGGFDRITVTGNTVSSSFPSGISLVSGRNSVIRDNNLQSIPGSVLRKNGRAVRTVIHIKGGSGNLVCGNVIPDQPNSPEARPCGR